MRSFLRAMILALAVSPFMPETAFSQAEAIVVEEHEDWAPPPQRRPPPPRRGWRNSPVTWSVAAVVLVVAIPLGVFKTVCQMRAWQAQQQRDKAPWERAMEQAERERMS